MTLSHQIAIRSVSAQPEKNLPMWARFLSGTAHGEEDLVKNTPYANYSG
jgi:hypothetical protein